MINKKIANSQGSLMNHTELTRLIDLWLCEDKIKNDITSEFTISQKSKSHAVIISREDGILCGSKIARKVFLRIDKEIKINFTCKDSEKINKGKVICKIYGSTKSILAGERTALNIISHLSGIATITSKFVQEVDGTKCKVLDTRKTTPGLRMLEKYAVGCGGGTNHRNSLSDMILIKDNHIKAAGSITKAINKVRFCLDSKLYVKSKDKKKNMLIEVETSNVKEVIEAVKCKADIIMLDNMTIEKASEALKHIPKGILSEISGNINLANIREYALLGIDRISVGSQLTLAARSLDISMKIL